MSNSDKALQWWDYIRKTHLYTATKDRGYYSNKYFGNRRLWKYLTTEDIELIYNKENAKDKK